MCVEEGRAKPRVVGYLAPSSLFVPKRQEVTWGWITKSFIIFILKDLKD